MDGIFHDIGYYMYFLIGDHRYWVGLLSGIIVAIIYRGSNLEDER